jgi:hypothetical protein
MVGKKNVLVHQINRVYPRPSAPALKKPDRSCGDFDRSTSYVNKTAGRSSPKISDQGPRSCANRLKRLNRLILLWYLQSPRSNCTLGKEKSLYVFLVEKTINGPAILGMNRGSSKSLNFPFFSKRQSWSNLGSSMHAVRACVLPILILVYACIFHSKFLARANLNTYTKLTSLEKLS